MLANKETIILLRQEEINDLLVKYAKEGKEFLDRVETHLFLVEAERRLIH